jgi:hypothetical protein
MFCALQIAHSFHITNLAYTLFKHGHCMRSWLTPHLRSVPVFVFFDCSRVGMDAAGIEFSKHDGFHHSVSAWTLGA